MVAILKSSYKPTRFRSNKKHKKNTTLVNYTCSLTGLVKKTSIHGVDAPTLLEAP
jgi:hypothetical protein